MENPIKMDDLGVPLFLETSIYTLEVSKTKSKLPGRGFGPSLEPFVSGGGFSTTKPGVGRGFWCSKNLANGQAFEESCNKTGSTYTGYLDPYW